jgi:hypothetical protein
MKKTLPILFSLLFPFFVFGQSNLIPNNSFENITDCDFSNNNGAILKATPWFAANSSGSSTDLYSVCDTTFYGVPNNYKGHQFAKSGNSYVGFIPWDGGGTGWYYREYAEVKLTNALQPGKTYCVSFYVNSSDYNTCYTSSVGAVFSSDSLLSILPPSGNGLIDTIPDILNSAMAMDSIGWTRIYGLYTCFLANKFITIGDFFDDAHTTFSSVSNGMYYFLDDVSVVEVSNADAGSDTSMCSGETIPIGGLPTFEADYTWYELADSAGSSSIDSIHIAKPHISPTQTTTYVMWKRQCNVVTTDTITITVNCVGLNNPIRKEEMTVFPNPATESIFVSYTGRATEVIICDVLGKELKRLPVKERKTEVNLSDLNEGIYFLSLIDKDKPVASKKIIVQH